MKVYYKKAITISFEISNYLIRCRDQRKKSIGAEAISQNKDISQLFQNNNGNSGQ